MEDLEGLRLDCFRMRQHGRAADVTDSQEMKKDQAVLLGVHSRLEQTRADFFGDSLQCISLDNPAIAAQQVEEEPIGGLR
jgi:hypothetical protein